MNVLQDFLAKKATEEEEVFKMVQEALDGQGITLYKSFYFNIHVIKHYNYQYLFITQYILQ